MTTTLKPVLDAILTDYALPLDGCHGVAHWARVLENGLRLASETGACQDVVTLFAVLHDSRRRNESFDPQHGPRAAAYAAQLWGQVFELNESDFRLLQRACEGHTQEHTHPNITVQTCWDSDRLDLGRVGIQPHPNRLCTAVARRPEVIAWADARARERIVPALVHSEWGIDVADTGIDAW